MKWQFLFISEEEKIQITNILKSRGLEEHYEEIVLLCFNLKEVEEYTENGVISYREEEAKEYEMLYNKHVSELAQLINKACLNNNLTLTTIDKRGNKAKLEIDRHVLKDLYNTIIESNMLNDKDLNEVVKHEERQIEHFIPSKYYIGYVLQKAISELKEKNIFNKNNKLVSIQEAGALFDILVIFKAITSNNYSTSKEKYDFIKNKVNSYRRYIEKLSK